MKKKRIKAYCIDFLVHIAFFLPVISYIVWKFYSLRENVRLHVQYSFEKYIYYYFIFSLLILLLKDFKNGSSIGKKISGIRIINNSTGNTPGILKMFLRNYINLLFTPIDIVFLRFERSFGDMIMNTSLVED